MFGFGRRTKVQHRAATAEPEAPADDEDDPAPASMPQVSQTIIEAAVAEARAYIAEAKLSHATARTPAEKVGAAREFVNGSKIGEAAVRLQDGTQHYHAWSQREDWPKHDDLGVSSIVPRTMCDQTTSHGFRWRDHDWLFQLEDQGESCSGEQKVGKLRLFFDGRLVMELAVCRPHGPEVPEWFPNDNVHAFVMGPWVELLLEMWAELDANRSRKWDEQQAAQLDEQASRIRF